MEKIGRAAVFGSGLMGSQIAELFAREAGVEVVLADIAEKFVRKGLQGIRDRLETHYVAKGKMTPEECACVLGRIRGTTTVESAVEQVDLVLEAVTENIGIKRRLFAELDRYAPARAIFASNTSYLRISEMASVTSRPEKVVGMHFFNPVARMKLVEVVTAEFTSRETTEAIVALAGRLGKETAVCSDHSFGFLANRAYFALRKEAVSMVWEGVAAPWDIDRALKLGHNLPVGPLELGDIGGSWGIYASSEKDRIAALGPGEGTLHPLVRMMVDAGYTGGSGNKGIYDYYREVFSKTLSGERDE